jgi:hypothetical protein
MKSPELRLQGRNSKSSTDGICIPHLLHPQESAYYPRKYIALTYDEAFLFHHYIVHLGRWLDCTDASRNFVIILPEKARQSPLLCQALLCFAGRHSRQDSAAEAVYQRCITMLIDRLNESAASHDETLLLTVLILHLADQLDGEFLHVHPLKSLPLTFSSAFSHGDARYAAFGRYFEHSPCFSKHSFH